MTSLHRSTIGTILIALCCCAQAGELHAQQKEFREIYRQLIETDTTASTGDSTRAVRSLQRHLLEAGFDAADMELLEPFPRKGNLVVRYRGSGVKKPMLLLAHIDVVEAKRADWRTDPFKLQERDGVFTARGAVDNKAMAAAFVSAFAQLKREGFAPRRDIVLALTADEELGDAPTNGTAWLLANRRELVAAEFGINEGGRGELKNGKPFVHVLQIGEKQFTTYEFEATGPGGHSARPTRDNTIYDLAEALLRLRRYQFPVRLNAASKTYFERSAAVAEGELARDMRAVAQGDAAAIERLSAQPNIVGLLRTTCVATMLKAGHARNALAQSAIATVNCRILPDDDPADITAALRTIAGDKVAVRLTRTSLRAPASPLLPDIVNAVETISGQMWPGVPVVPTMGVSTTDSRFFRDAGIPMYGVSGMFVDPADTGVHGLNEHIGARELYDGREFLYRLIKLLAG